MLYVLIFLLRKRKKAIGGIRDRIYAWGWCCSFSLWSFLMRLFQMPSVSFFVLHCLSASFLDTRRSSLVEAKPLQFYFPGEFHSWFFHYNYLFLFEIEQYNLFELQEFLKDFTYLFLERGGGREKERERNINPVVASHVAPSGDLAHNPGICPDWELSWWPFGSQPTLSPLSHSSQGRILFFLWKMSK